MPSKKLIPILAIAGVLAAVLTIVLGSPSSTGSSLISSPARSPYLSAVAGSGLVEASTENISIGTPIAGIVSQIYVQIGSSVKAGMPLFTIDDRATRAEIETRRAAVQLAEAQLAEAKYDLDLMGNLSGKGVTTKDDLMKKRFAVQKTNAQLAEAQAELKGAETELERLTVCAPVDGTVLQLKVHLGEFAQVAASTPGQPPLVLLGQVDPLHLRVDVDENEAWRVASSSPAMGYLRGNREIKTPLQFVRFEPYVVPKKSLSSDSTERSDTRVLQVIYRFDRGTQPIFVGQQMDVFIEVVPAEKEGRSTAVSSAGP